MIKTALSQYGQKEIDGEAENPTIVNYAKEVGFKWVNSEDTPWCSIFMNWVAMKAGYEYTRKANARSWLDIGSVVDEPKVGDVVVFQRGNNGYSGHVGMFICKYDDGVYVLGGNQSDSVKISKYKLKDVLGYRRLKKEVVN
jgi:uncharacterized protein (TIGR02594 family)